MKRETVNLDWPLMREGVTRKDTAAIVDFLGTEPMPRLTQSKQVAAFEEEFAAWLGVKHAVFVNSGASANLITMAALHDLHGELEIAVPCLTWISDIASVLHAGHTPIFVDVDPRTLGMSASDAKCKFVTHALGFDAGVHTPLVEDCCEAMGATRGSRKLGTFGLASNFSFYYGHHMSTIEGGMVCTDDANFYQTLRMLRSHGLTREMTDGVAKEKIAKLYPDLYPEFTFAFPAYNVRSTELNAVIGRSQLKRVDANNKARTFNLLHFLCRLDPTRYRTEYRTEGSCSFALPLVLAEPDERLMQRVVAYLEHSGVEIRRGTVGGGNQLRQPYAKALWGNDFHKEFPQAEYLHQYGLFVGNYPGLERWKIEALTDGLNRL